MSIFQRRTLYIHLTLLMFFGVPDAYSCEADKDAPYPPLIVDGGLLVFESTPVLEDEGKPNPEMGLGISFLDCNSSMKKFVARLPYVADPGKVKDAFVGNRGDDHEDVFVIHSAPIRAFTGVSYGSEYFSVIAFHKVAGGYALDSRITAFFGSGADVVLRGEDSDKPLYTYPYKSRSDVVAKLASEKYLKWLQGRPVKLEVIRKTYLYSSMAIAYKTKMYLIKGDRVGQEAVSAGWNYIVYKNAKGKEIKGWVLCEDVDGC
ncbi:hypothetical protein [Pseudomonas quasicaspiana]|uniref:hypothetical protein n=1 Tax=Pseudomonas quasicaspiana TaxID=2829821 RepID=UPI001E3CDD03|nr:hypothetical protein [Pseudomonas quasicaspiana]